MYIYSKSKRYSIYTNYGPPGGRYGAGAATFGAAVATGTTVSGSVATPDVPCLLGEGPRSGYTPIAAKVVVVVVG